MRGYVNEKGDSRPNYHYEDLMQLHKLYEEKGIKNPACIVDCNHANSGKQYLEQIRIATDVRRRPGASSPSRTAAGGR